MKEIKLTQGYIAIVDDMDYPMLSQHIWHIQKERLTIYAVTNDKKKHGRKIRMHRMIMGSKGSLFIDHIDGNGLNNSRANLRFVTHSQNAINSRKKSGLSKYRGVKKTTTSGTGAKPWRAQLWLGDKWLSLGNHATEEEAAKAVDAAAIIHRGEFARLNFPLGLSGSAEIAPWELGAAS